MKNQTDYFCRVSGQKLNQIIDFGKQPLGNAFVSKDSLNNEFFYSMKVGFDNKSKMFQLMKQPSPKKIFHKEYAFFSSTSESMKLHFENFAKSIIDSEYLQKKPFVIELGCNDGIMLKHFSKKNIDHLGIDPADNVAKEAKKCGINILNSFFNEKLAKQIKKNYGPSDAILAANVMCHIPNIINVIKGMKILLKPTGVIVFEDPYLGDVIDKTSYDQIYDEHVFLFSGLSIKYLFNLFELELIDVLKQNTHGGSMRYIIAHKSKYPIHSSVNQLIEKELELGLDDCKNFKRFSSKVNKSKDNLVSLLKKLKKKGKRVAGYAATSKSTTILNYCNISNDLIEYISDTTPIKQNKLSPGMHIPIYDRQYFIENPPDYAFLFAWNHMDEILKKEGQFSQLGGKWIVHIPEVKIL